MKNNCGVKIARAEDSRSDRENVFRKAVHAIFVFSSDDPQGQLCLDSGRGREGGLRHGAVTSSPSASQLTLLLALATCPCAWPGTSAAAAA